MNAEPGKLSILGTPIGNLEDITLRALRVLREADLIAAEDTRRTGQLLARYGISKPLVSYHEFNEAKRTPELLQKLLSGQKIALVSDAGMPTLSDPGTRLIRAVVEAGGRSGKSEAVAAGFSLRGNDTAQSGKVTNMRIKSADAGVKPATTEAPGSPISLQVVPGPSAVTAALAASGLSGGPFLFHGFLPHKTVQRRKVLEKLAPLSCTLVFFESPYRLQKSLADMLEILGDRQAVVARELTKKFEELLRDNLSGLLKSLENRRVKGEITVVIEGQKRRTEVER